MAISIFFLTINTLSIFHFISFFFSSKLQKIDAINPNLSRNFFTSQNIEENVNSQNSHSSQSSTFSIFSSYTIKFSNFFLCSTIFSKFAKFLKFSECLSSSCCSKTTNQFGMSTNIYTSPPTQPIFMPSNESRRTSMDASSSDKELVTPKGSRSSSTNMCGKFWKIVRNLFYNHLIIVVQKDEDIRIRGVHIFIQSRYECWSWRLRSSSPSNGAKGSKEEGQIKSQRKENWRKCWHRLGRYKRISKEKWFWKKPRSFIRIMNFLWRIPVRWHLPNFPCMSKSSDHVPV